MTLDVKLLWKLTSILLMLIGSSQGKGSNPAVRYRAMRYGNYYSNVYYTYSGGKGYARYSRVYSHTKNKYPAFYNYMFDWFKTEQFKVYKNTPSGSISVCKNYEANENGTYLGIFTCPLPFVPEDLSYCCGLTNAQYCCKFWDIPLNFAAAVVALLMALVLLLASIHVIIQMCIIGRKTNEENKRRKAVRRIGLLRRRGRKASSRSMWAHALFEHVHAESKFSESRSSQEEEEEDTGCRNRQIQKNVITTMISLHGLNSNNGDKNKVTNLEKNDEECFKEPDRLAPIVKKERANSIESGFIEERSVCDVSEKGGTTNMTFTPSWTENRESDATSLPGSPLKALRGSPRITFNGNWNPKTFLAPKYH